MKLIKKKFFLHLKMYKCKNEFMIKNIGNKIQQEIIFLTIYQEYYKIFNLIYFSFNTFNGKE